MQWGQTPKFPNNFLDFSESVPAPFPFKSRSVPAPLHVNLTDRLGIVGDRPSPHPLHHHATDFSPFNLKRMTPDRLEILDARLRAIRLYQRRAEIQTPPPHALGRKRVRPERLGMLVRERIP